MVRVKVTRNYQVTIPAEVRGEAGISIGDYLEVTVDDKGRIVMSKVRDERLRLKAGRKLTPEDIEKLIARGMGEALGWKPS